MFKAQFKHFLTYKGPGYTPQEVLWHADPPDLRATFHTPERLQVRGAFLPAILQLLLYRYKNIL